MAIRTAVINVRMEPSVKKQAATVFSEAGLSFSDAVNAFCKETIRRQSIPFRFTARKTNPVDISKKTKEELWSEIHRAEKQLPQSFDKSVTQFKKEHRYLNERI